MERDQAVNDLIDLTAVVDEVLEAQSQADAGYFFTLAETPLGESERQRVRKGQRTASAPATILP